ncbi:hypothetical protein MKL29_10285 [Streptococcus suis]|nr:hypothetical protein [Streptococcus suis]
MTISYNSDALIEEVLDDLAEFGEDLPVFAIYSWFEEYQVEFVTDYLFADKPERLPIGQWTQEDEKDFQAELREYQDSMKLLELRKHKQMTIADLLTILEKQNKLF